MYISRTVHIVSHFRMHRCVVIILSLVAVESGLGCAMHFWAYVIVGETRSKPIDW